MPKHGNKNHKLEAKDKEATKARNKSTRTEKAGESAYRSVGGDFSQRTFEQHVALLSDSRMSQPTNASVRREIMIQMQRDYGNPYVQRLVDHIRRTRKEMDEPEVGMEGGDVGPEFQRSVDKSKGQGQQLPDELRTDMESAFGADFSSVRIHADSGAAELNRSISARAFTTGQDIYFGEGEYSPESQSGKETLAHELTHVVQQEDGALADSQSQRLPLLIQRDETDEEDEEVQELYDPGLEVDDQASLGMQESIDSSPDSQEEEDDGGAPDEQDVQVDAPTDDTGSGYIDGKVLSDTDVYDYTGQGTEYTVATGAPVGHITKGDKIKVADVVDTTGTKRMVERGVGIGFVDDKAIQFDVSKFAKLKAGTWDNKSFVSKGINAAEKAKEVEAAAQGAEINDGLTKAWGRLGKAKDTAESLDESTDNLSETAKDLSFFGKIVAGAGYVGDILGGLVNGVLAFTKIKSTFINPIQELFKMRARNKVAKALDKAAQSTDNDKVAEAAHYGYKKAKRGFRVHMWRMIAGFARMILRVITLLSGGTTSIVTVPADAVITVMKLADKAFHKIKGFWKFVTGRRGKGRATNAGTLVTGAQNGDTAALQLLVDLKPSFAAKMLDKAKEKLKKLGAKIGIIDNYYPSSTQEMFAVISSLDKKEINQMKKSMAKKLKSV